jgi:hypothetical protein
MKKTKVVKVKRKVISKAELETKVKEAEDRLAWATRIVQTQQAEIDRLMKLNDKLTNILDQFSKKDC